MNSSQPTNTVKKYVRKLESDYPKIILPVTTLARWCRNRANSLKTVVPPGPNIRWIKPQRVRFILNKNSLKKQQLVTSMSLEMGGNWDRLITKISVTGNDSDLVEKIMLNHSWGRVEYTNEVEFQTLNSGMPSVCIGRSGEPILYDGVEYLVAAKKLEISEMPVFVAVRHKGWARFRRELFTLAFRSKNKLLCRFFDYSSYGGKLYQLAYHFDTKDVPFSHGEERFKEIEKNLSLKHGTVLDIGANFGYLCYKMEGLGFDCCAVELKATDVYFMRKLRDACNCRFDIMHDSIFNLNKDSRVVVDVALALYIFHHFLKSKSMYDELVRFLNRLDCKELFLGTHDPSEAQMKDAYKNYKPREFVEFIKKNTGLKKDTLLAEYTVNGRSLFKLY